MDHIAPSARVETGHGVCEAGPVMAGPNKVKTAQELVGSSESFLLPNQVGGTRGRPDGL